MSEHASDFAHEHLVSAEQLTQFRKDGFLVLPKVCSPAAIARIRPAVCETWQKNRLDVRPMAERDTYGRAFTQGLNLGLRDRRVFSFAYGRLFAKLAADLMGVPGVRMFLDEAFFKEPGSGHTPWHQDQAAWPFDATGGVTLWIPLMEMTPEMGTLTFAAGSHHHQQLVDADISDESDAALSALVSQHRFPEVAVGAIAVGDVTAHDGWMVHRAGANPTGVCREAYAMHYFADGARVTQPSSPVRARILKHFAPDLQPGDLAASEWWRQVFPEIEPLVRTL